MSVRTPPPAEAPSIDARPLIIKKMHQQIGKMRGEDSGEELDEQESIEAKAYVIPEYAMMPESVEIAA